MCSRFLTESTGLLPKWFDLLEFLFLPALFLLIAVAARSEANLFYRGSRVVSFLILFFLLAVILSALLNHPFLHPPAVILYCWSFILPPLTGVMVSLAEPDMKRMYVRALIILGVVQIVVVLGYQFPRFLMSDGNPDIITGTFGLNGTQLAAFLVLSGGAHVTWLGMGRKMYLAIIAGLLYLLLFLLLSFRLGVPALLVTGIALLFAWCRRLQLNAGKAILAGTALMSGIVLLFLAATRFFPLLQYDSLLFYADLDQIARTGKGAGYLQTLEMFHGNPSCIPLGSGPATLVSRAFSTFQFEPGFADASSGIGAYVRQWSYPPDRVHPNYTRYMQPVWEGDPALVAGHSGQLAVPSSSVLSLMAETGVAGFIPFLLIHLVLIRFAWRKMIHLDRNQPEAIALAGGLFSSAIFVTLIGSIGDFWEVSRITLPVWISYGILACGAVETEMIPGRRS